MTAHAGQIVAARSKAYKCSCLHLYANCSHPDTVQRGTVGAYYGHRWHILIYFTSLGFETYLVQN